MSHHHPGPRLLAVVAAIALALLPAPAMAAPPAGADRPQLTYRESDCTEIAYQRGGLADKVRSLVPDRFSLTDFPGVPEGAPPRVVLYVNEVTCARSRFNDHGGTADGYTFLIVSAPVTASDGNQRDGAYILFYATDSRSQQSVFRRLGWPVTSLGHRTTTQPIRDTDGIGLGLALHVTGGGWDHDLAAVATAPPPDLATSSAEYYRDSPHGPRTLCYANNVRVTTATYSGDLRGTHFASVAYVPPRFTGYPGSLVQGSWDATITTSTCPTS